MFCNPTPPPFHTVPATTDVFLTSRDLLFYNLVIPTSVLSQLFPSRDHLQNCGPPQCWKQKKTARQQIPLNESRSLYALSLHLNLCSDLPSYAHTRTHTQFLSPERRRFFCRLQRNQCLTALRYTTIITLHKVMPKLYSEVTAGYRSMTPEPLMPS